MDQKQLAIDIKQCYYDWHSILLKEKYGCELEYAYKIFEFWKEKKDVDISLEMIKREFYDNTPSAFIDVIEKL